MGVVVGGGLIDRGRVCLPEAEVVVVGCVWSEADRIDGVPDGRHGASVAPVSEHDAEAAETAEALGVRRGLVTCEWHGASAWSEKGWARRLW